MRSASSTSDVHHRPLDHRPVRTWPRGRSRWSKSVLASWILFAGILIGVHPVRAGIVRPAVTLLSQSTFVGGTEGSTWQTTLQVSRAIVSAADSRTRLVISSHRPVQMRSEVRLAVDGELPEVIDSVEYSLVDLLLNAPTESAAGRVDLTVPIEISGRSTDALLMPTAGLHPLSIDVEMSGQRVVRLITFVERLAPESSFPASSEPTSLALVGRLDGPISLQTNGDALVSPASRQRMADLVSVLEQRPALSMTTMIRPEFAEAFSRSTPEDQELLIRLQRTASFDTMSTTYASMDPSDTEQQGLAGIFTRQLRLGESTLSSLFPTRVAPRHSWLQSRSLSPGGARILADLGFRTVVLPLASRLDANGGEDAVFAGVDPTHLVELSFSEEGSITGAVSDTNTALALERGSSRPDGGEHLVAHQILADLKTWRLELQRNDIDPGRRALVLSTPSGELPSPAMLAALFDVVGRDPRFIFTTLDTALDDMVDVERLNFIELADVDISSTSLTSTPAVAAVVQSLGTEIDAYASALPRGDDRVRSWRRVLDVIPDDRLDSEDRRAYTDAVRAQIREISSAVVPPASTTFTLGGRNSPIRFSIRNDGTTDLDVLVRLRSSKLRLPEGDKIVTLPAQTSTTVEFAVSARSNGQFPVILQLLTPSGEQSLGGSSTLTARVNALAGLGQLVTGISLLILASWWVNHLRREFRRRQAEADLGTHRHPSGENPNRENPV